MSKNAFFLWVGSALPDLARISVLSAAGAGFDVVLYTDRAQQIDHPRLRLADWREIDTPWTPEEVRLKGDDRPYFAGFADLFRYSLLSQKDGWWFDCDTLILRPKDHFSALLLKSPLIVGEETDGVVNNAVIGSTSKKLMARIRDAVLPLYPVFSRWGQSGPALITRMISTGEISAHVVTAEHFYPIHHGEIARIYQPACRDALRSAEKEWYCLSLWGEVLSRSGLRHLAPPPGSYLAELLGRHPEWGGISGDPAALADYLATNLQTLTDMDSGRLALRTVLRKASARMPWRWRS